MGNSVEIIDNKAKRYQEGYCGDEGMEDDEQDGE